MGIWQRLRGIEDRQASGSYTDALVSLIQSQSGRLVGSTGGNGGS